MGMDYSVHRSLLSRPVHGKGWWHKMKAVVLLSGGLDSTTALAVAKERFGRDVTALSIYYGQRHEREIVAAQDIAEKYGVEHEIRDVTIPRGASVLMHHRAEMPHKSYAEIEGVSPTYVPFRNGIFLSHATALALDCEADEVWFGAHADDADRWAYPDCTPEFIGTMAAAIYIGTYHKVRLVAPFTHHTKAEIVAAGLHLGVPYEMTVSCYEGNENGACGMCPTCISRLEAFDANNVPDPAPYMTGVKSASP